MPETNEAIYYLGKVQSIVLEKQQVHIYYEGGMQANLIFYKENVFRLYVDKEKKFITHPIPRAPEHDTLILEKDLEYYQKEYGEVVPTLQEMEEFYQISTSVLFLVIEKENGLMFLKDKKQAILWKEAEPL